MTDPIRHEGIVSELRELIQRAAPDPSAVAAVIDCAPDVPLDRLMPFSSIVVLGVVVAVEDRFSIRVTRDHFARASRNGASLSSLAAMIAELIGAPSPEEAAR